MAELISLKSEDKRKLSRRTHAGFVTSTLPHPASEATSMDPTMPISVLRVLPPRELLLVLYVTALARWACEDDRVCREIQVGLEGW